MSLEWVLLIPYRNSSNMAKEAFTIIQSFKQTRASVATDFYTFIFANSKIVLQTRILEETKE
jgi:hypothetical protein